MSELKQGLGESDEWYTPPYIFNAIRLTFDLDPCSPGQFHWVPAKKVFTVVEDGLSRPWAGSVFMNPPFGGRNGHLPWLDKFLSEGVSGVILVRAYTSSKWFQDYAPRFQGMLFPRGKTKFVRPDGSVGKSPSSGIVLWARDSFYAAALKNSGLGLYVERR